MKDTHARSVIKGISWRLVGTIDTIIVSYIVLGEIGQALTIGITEVITKIILYYFHERAWNAALGHSQLSNKQMILKAFSWRLTGTIDTMILSLIIITFSAGDSASDISPLAGASKIGGIELVTKMTLFYAHEWVWLRIPYGRVPADSK